MADIITRLLLKTNDFDANLNKAKGSVNQFQGGIANMAKTAGAGVMKFAGAIGVAVGAYEGLNKVISSSQPLSDEYNRTIDGLKGSVDEFFYSIGSGDWTPFFNGLDETIRKAREAYTALDQLGNTKMSYGYFNMRNQAELQDQITILRDKTSTDAQKKAAKQRVSELLKDQEEITEQLKRRSNEAMQSLVAQGTGLNAPDVSLMSIERTLRFDVSAIGDQEKARLAKEYADFQTEAERLKQKYTKIEMMQVGAGRNKSMVPMERVDSEKLNKAMAPVLAKYQDAINYNTILVKRSDEWLQNLINIGAEAFSAERNYASMVKASNRASQSTTGGSGKDKPTPPPVGSLAALDAEITKQNKKLAEATTMQARAAVQATIQELEQKKIVLELEVKKEVFKNKYGEMKDQSLSFPATSNTPIVGDYQAQQALINWYNQSIAAKKAELSNVTDADARLSIQMQINKLERLLKEYKEAVNKAESVSSGSIYSAFRNNSSKGENGEELDFRKQLDNMKLPKFKSPIKKDDVNLNKEYAESLEGVGTAFGSMGQMASQFGEDGLAFALNSVGTIAQMIIQLESLATAQGVASAMALPFPENLGAIATVIGAITSIFSSLPTFETGGIIPGTSFSGDKVLARVNSGEMILNSEQQSNLFKMLNSKLYGGLNIGRPNIEPQMGNIAALIAPGGDNQKIELAGNIRIKAQELELILKNRERITGRIR